MFAISGLYRSFFFFQAEDGIRDYKVTGVQTCALPISGGIADERREHVPGPQGLTDRHAQRFLAPAQENAAVDFAGAIEAGKFVVERAGQQHTPERPHEWFAGFNHTTDLCRFYPSRANVSLDCSDQCALVLKVAPHEAAISKPPPAKKVRAIGAPPGSPRPRANPPTWASPDSRAGLESEHR